MNGRDAGDGPVACQDVDQAEVGHALHQQLGQADEGRRIVGGGGQELARARHQEELCMCVLGFTAALLFGGVQACALEGDRALAPERLRKRQVRLVEPRYAAETKRERSHHTVIEEKRNREVALAARRHRSAREVRPSRVGLVPGGDDHRPPRLECLRHGARKFGGELVPMIEEAVGIPVCREHAQVLPRIDELGHHPAIRVERQHRSGEDGLAHRLDRKGLAEVTGDVLQPARSLQRPLGLLARGVRSRHPNPREQLDLGDQDGDEDEQHDDPAGAREVEGQDAERADRHESGAGDPRPAQAGTACVFAPSPPHRTPPRQGIGP